MGNVIKVDFKNKRVKPENQSSFDLDAFAHFMRIRHGMHFNDDDFPADGIQKMTGGGYKK